FGSAPEALNLAGYGKSPDHYAKGTPSPGTCVRRAPTARRRVVSGSLSSPGRGSSHRSLALLGPLSVAGEYLALRDGPRRFGPTSAWSALLRCQAAPLPLSRTGLSPSGVALSRALPLGYRVALCLVLQPPGGKPPGFGLVRVRSPLLTESRFLSLPGGTEMFQFPPLAARAYGFGPR